MNDGNQSDDNVIQLAEWKARKQAEWLLRKVWVHLPIRDPKEPSGYRWELVETIPLPPMY